MSRWLYLLLLAVPVTVIAESLHWPSLVIFICASIALIPLAGLIGLSTEALAERLGHRIGGLLNATFGVTTQEGSSKRAQRSNARMEEVLSLI